MCNTYPTAHTKRFSLIDGCNLEARFLLPTIFCHNRLVVGNEMGFTKKNFSLKAFFKSHKKSDAKYPTEFICPISESLMADPVIVSSGQSYERRCIEAWMESGYRKCCVVRIELVNSSLIPNIALRNAILNWCSTAHIDVPKPPSEEDAKRFVKRKVLRENDSSGANSEGFSSYTSDSNYNSDSETNYISQSKSDPNIHDSSTISSSSTRSFNVNLNKDCIIERASSSISASSSLQSSLDSAAGFSHSTMSSISSGQTNSSISLQESDVSGSVSTQLRCYSFPEIVEEVEETNSDLFQETVRSFVHRLTDLNSSERGQAVSDLRRLTRSNVEIRTSLCVQEMLSCLLSLIKSGNSEIQTDVVAALVNLSLENGNKVRIVRAGAIPYLIDVLKTGSPEAQEHAAGAIFSLALNDDNKIAIGVLGAISPLLNILNSGCGKTRHDAVMALYHLSLAQNNKAKLVKAGAVPILLNLSQDEKSALASKCLIILHHVAASSDGCKALLDANGIPTLFAILAKHCNYQSKKSLLIQEHCLAVLIVLSRNNIRFKSLAMEACALEHLVAISENGSSRTKEKASILLDTLKSETHDGQSVSLRSHWNTLGLSHTSGANSSEF